MTEAPTPDSLRVGSLVGPWRVEGFAGRGAYGVVYRARRAGHPGSQPVALKLALLPSDPRFEREAELLARFQHPSLPQLLDRGCWHATAEVKHPYVVMEWIRGLPLYDWAREHCVSSRQVLKVVAQVAWGLEVLHRGGSLHRDIKGGNILVEPEGRAVITDFGSGTWAGAPPLTERIMAPGTREYRSPEALLFELKHWGDKNARYEARPADDLYALGVSVYRLLTEVYPPPPITPEEVKGAPVMPPPPRVPPQALNESVVPELAALIERMLARQPEARGTGRELAEAAESAAEHGGAEADRQLGREQLSAKPVVSARGRAGAGVKAPAVEPVAARVQGGAGQRAYSWRGRFMLLAAVVVIVALVGTWWGGHRPDEEAPQVARTKVRGGAMVPKAGTRGLGDSTATTRAATQGVPGGSRSEAVSTEMPEHPLPGQRRAPCRGLGQVEINGGCWRKQADTPVPCPDDTYEWKDACYYPIIDRVHPRSSKKLR